jgi:hypothetical protein
MLDIATAKTPDGKWFGWLDVKHRDREVGKVEVKTEYTWDPEDPENPENKPEEEEKPAEPPQPQTVIV